MKKKLIKWGIILSIGGTIGSFLWAWIEVSRLLAPKRELYSEKIFLEKGFVPLEVRVENQKVQCWFLSGTKKTAIIFSVGYGGSSITLLKEGAGGELIEKLKKEGFYLIFFDPRGAGKSEGKFYLFGANQVEDILEIVRVFKEKEGIEKFFILGFSAGANAAILAQKKNPIEIKGVVADSPFLALEKISLYPKILVKILKIVAYLRIGSINFIEKISLEKISPQNVFYIVGEKDKLTPPFHSLTLFEKTEGHRALWIVKEAEHCQAVILQPEEYFNKILTFFNELEGPF